MNAHNNPKDKDKLLLNNDKEVVLNVENHSKEEKLITDSHPKKNAKNAIPPKAWENQEKAYNDEWENNKNNMLDDDL
ncbi:hypothetical protein [Kaistella sp.]|uniref:hypothetical protein n=1 Tax=Kaistella sp. TaxID=2782235 RepID=UPI003C45D90A